MYTEEYRLLTETLSQSRIPFERHIHEAVHTMEDCYRVQVLAEDTVMPKNIFLCNRQQTDFYLYLCPPFEPFRTAVFSKALGVSRLSFAGDEHLFRMLRVSPGAVTPLALLFDRGRQVQLVMDNRLLKAERLAFHPLIPTETFIFRREDFLARFLPLTGHEARFVSL